MSDDPIQVMHEEMQRSRASETMGNMGGMGERGGGRGAGGGRGTDRPEDPMAAAERLEQMNRGAETIVIAQEGSTIRIRYADGRERSLVADGKKHLRESGIGDLQTKTKWKGDDKLVVHSTTEQRQSVTETYEYSPHRTRLHVMVRVDGKGGGPSFRFERVYERLAAEQP